MTRDVVLNILGILLLGAVIGRPDSAWAQNNQFTERSFVSSPVVLGMGDAGVALSGWEQGFFYNPAHLSRIPSHFTVFGIQAGVSPSLDDNIRFFNQRVPPVLQTDSELSADALDAFQRDATSLARRPSRGMGSVLLPSFVYSPGPLGIGGGLFTKTAANYRIESGAVGVPSVWMLSRTDLMALLSVGFDLEMLGLSGLSVGLTGTQTRRYLAFKNKPVSRLTENETAVILEGGTFQLDSGFTYSPPSLGFLPGTIRVGGAVYDLLDRGYGYTAGGAGRLPFINDVVDEPAADSLGPGSREIQRAREQFSLHPSYRVGVAYQQPALLFLENVGLAVDYQGYRTGEQSLLARLHVGARATVVGPLRVRAGLSSGYPSGGLGVEVGALHVDYSVHGVEEGRHAGQLRSYVHTARLLVRLE